MKTQDEVAVIIPCFRVRGQILSVLKQIGQQCGAIYVVDDACPDKSGQIVEEHFHDPRVRVLYHTHNQGVGGATLTGMLEATKEGYKILVKLDGDGQMDPALIDRFVQPIRNNQADYTKGNRFYRLDHVGDMPAVRMIGNMGLSFMTKLSSGYWDVFDPTNGFLAIHADVFRELPHEKISRRFFFESDMLFRLYCVRAVVRDIPIRAVYGDEQSSLNPSKVLLEFFFKNWRNYLKRIFYVYFLRHFSIASIYLLLGLPLLMFGVIYGAVSWHTSIHTGIEASGGVIMLASLPIIIGFQMLLSFLAVDMNNIPRYPIHELFTSLDLATHKSIPEDPKAKQS